MTCAWSRAKSTPSPATMRRMVSCLTAVTCTGPALGFRLLLFGAAGRQEERDDEPAVSVFIV